jgi:starch phosphorylase
MWSHVPGSADLRRSADQLASRLPTLLAPLARIAYNYRWSWTPGGAELFAAVDAHRWGICRHNPVRLLQEAPSGSLDNAAADRELRRRAQSFEECIMTGPAPAPAGPITVQRPVAFFCAEYGIHPSLPIYAGGLGVLAGDILKAASDRGLPMVGVGLLYRQGYFRQRIDVSGWQHEYWVDFDPELAPAALVTRDGVEPLTVAVPIRGRLVVAQIWRVDVGRVPLYLLDAERSENAIVDRWISSRLYVGDRETRLAQYALLGLGGAMALRAMGFDPSVIHLNEGHAALAPLPLVEEAVRSGMTLDAALSSVRQRTVFTTHTPVPAGNESYSLAEVQGVLAGLPERLGTDWTRLQALGRTHPTDANEPLGITQTALKLSRAANGVSRRHGETARAMWRPMFPGRSAEQVPIGHVTNGVHVSTWMAPAMRALIDRHLGPAWIAKTAAAETWARFDEIPDSELWAVRRELRAELVEFVRARATSDRLARGEPPEYVAAAARAFDPEHLTIGFARRLAGYKRLGLIMYDLQRSLKLLVGDRPVQILLAGKAHPQDDEAKRIVQRLFQVKGAPFVGERIAYLHDYDMSIAQQLVAGCDVWVNVPRPPLEASGTSGMKAALNGGLNLSVLDGWWAEAYDGSNGWAIDGDGDPDPEATDRRHGARLIDLLEHEAVPTFYQRDSGGLPRTWIAHIRASIRTAASRFSADRMVSDYVQQVYLTPERR